MSRPSAPRRRIPPYIPITFVVMVLVQLLVYYGTRLILPYLTVCELTGPVDESIPFSPPWVTIYCLAFPFWVLSGLRILADGKDSAYRFASSYILALLLAAACFLLWPGTIARPEITGSGFFDNWLRLIYRIDSPTNLCPSLHVVITYFCFRCASACRNFPRWYSPFSLVFLILVCCSVLLVKQHAFIDVPAGVVVGELSLLLGRIMHLERVPLAVEKLFRKE